MENFMGSKLLAIGCSYTAPGFVSFDPSVPEHRRGPWDMWPELLADELGLECINKGQGGVGQDYIWDTFMGQLAEHGDDIDTVAILWSGSDRSKLFSFHTNPFIQIYDNATKDKDHWVNPDDGVKFRPHAWAEELGIEEFPEKYVRSKWFKKSWYSSMINGQLSKILAVLEICKARNIKVVMGQGVMLFPCAFLKDLAERELIPADKILDATEVGEIVFYSKFFKELQKHKKNLFGFPFWKELGGWSIDDKRWSKTRWGNQLYNSVSAQDSHPNAEGQEEIAAEFINKYRALYG
jgi:hypothetical protein